MHINTVFTWGAQAFNFTHTLYLVHTKIQCTFFWFGVVPLNIVIFASFLREEREQEIILQGGLSYDILNVRFHPLKITVDTSCGQMFWLGHKPNLVVRAGADSLLVTYLIGIKRLWDM